jgi:sugar lactone lactonase YvrE
MKTPLSISLLFLTILSTLAADFDVRNETEFKKIISTDAKVEKLADGFGFTEGPVWTPLDGGCLIFSDIPKNQLKKWTRAGGVTTFREPSHNANGNTLDQKGRLVSAEHSARRISVTEKEGTVKTLVESSDGKKFNSPNDVVVRSDGTVWFTDPPYGLPKDEKKEQEGNYVYRFDPASGRRRPS